MESFGTREYTTHPTCKLLRRSIQVFSLLSNLSEPFFVGALDVKSLMLSFFISICL